MNMSLCCLQYNIDIHMVHNSDMEINIIHFVSNSVKDNIMRWDIPINYRINSDKQWIVCICITNTPNVEPHKIQHEQCQTEEYLAAVPTSIPELPVAQVAAKINPLVTDPRAVAAVAAVMPTREPLAVGPTPMNISNHGMNSWVIKVVMRALEGSR